MPMLDEQEFAAVAALRDEAFLDEYERLTSYREKNPNAVWHHRLALYGPPCRVCSKPLRTPKASRCVACGADR
jgi:hypothetical protein